MNEIIWFSIMSGFTLFLGIIFGIVSVILYQSNLKRVARCTGQTVGIITDIIEEEVRDVLHEIGDGYMVSYFPIVKYTVDGRVVHQRYMVGQRRPLFTVGDAVTVHYNPDKISEFYMEHKGINVKKLSRIFGAISFLLVLVGTLFFVVFVIIK